MAKRARHDLPAVQDKRAKVVELRSLGWTWDRIAAEAGYSNGSAASKAWRAAIRQRPDQTVDEVRSQERTRLEAMDSRLSDIIARPPIKTTSIGRTQYDVRTCTCTVKGRTDEPHEPGCQVQPVLDETAVIAAIKERRQIGESLRRLTGADAAPLPGVGLSEQQVRMMAEVIVAQRDRAQQVPLQLAPLPGGYHDLPPEEQARLQIERHRTAKQAQDTELATALTPQPGDNDVVEAEIVA